MVEVREERNLGTKRRGGSLKWMPTRIILLVRDERNLGTRWGGLIEVDAHKVNPNGMKIGNNN